MSNLIKKLFLFLLLIFSPTLDLTQAEFNDGTVPASLTDGVFTITSP